MVLCTAILMLPAKPPMLPIISDDRTISGLFESTPNHDGVLSWLSEVGGLSALFSIHTGQTNALVLFVLQGYRRGTSSERIWKDCIPYPQ